MSWPLSANAATLTCDPQVGVERYEFFGLATIAEFAALPGGVLLQSVDSIPAGPYLTFKARACQGVWCSEWAEYPFEKPDLTPPARLRIGK
jgi:hypothetical protein